MAIGTYPIKLYRLACDRCGDAIQPVKWHMGRFYILRLPTQQEVYVPDKQLKHDPSLVEYVLREVVFGDFIRLQGSICNVCTRVLAKMEKIVRNGGIYWSCEQCGCSGVLQGTLADSFRKIKQIPAPKPATGRFRNCRDHGGAENLK